MAKILEKYEKIQQEHREIIEVHGERLDHHEKSIDIHDLALYGNEKNDIKGVIQNLKTIAVTVNETKETLRKYIWMFMGASAVGGVMGGIIFFLLEILWKNK